MRKFFIFQNRKIHEPIDNNMDDKASRNDFKLKFTRRTGDGRWSNDTLLVRVFEG